MSQQNQITINNKKYLFSKNQTILDVCLANGLFVPTLCKHPDLKIEGRCRICLVEIEGGGLATSCSTPAVDGMKVRLDTPAVIRARKTNLKMIWSEHSRKCSSCIDDGHCFLKNYASNDSVSDNPLPPRKGDWPVWLFGASEPRFPKFSSAQYAGHKQAKRAARSDYELRKKQALLHAAGFIQFDASKCIDCGICTEICREKQTVDFYETVGKGFSTQTKPTDNIKKDCTYCGQCIVHCPVGAIHGVAHWPVVEELLNTKKKHGKLLVAQIAPSIRVSIGEEFGLDYGQVVTGQLSASMRALGFDAAFDVTTGADFTTYEEARELIHWLERGKDRPMFTSCCPGWVKFVEFYYPEFISHLTTTRSPEIISGFLAKTYWADLIKKNPKDILVVSIMPCTAKKREISLAEHRLTLGTGKNAFSLPAVDYVLTTREYAYLLKKSNIDLKKIKPEKMDNPLGVESGAAVIYGASGGVMESALRTADYFLRVKKETGDLSSALVGQNYQLKKYKFSSLAQSRLEFRAARGLQGVKEAVVAVAGIELKVAVVNGLGNARMILEKIKNGLVNYDYVEVMACPGGCIGGGGQPVPVSESIRQKRAAALYSLDERAVIRTAHENLSLLSVYQNYFQGDEKKMEELFHSRHSFLGRGGYKEV